MMMKRRYSLKKKTMLVMIVAFAVVGIASISLFYKAVIDITRSEYVAHCSDLANTVARSLDESNVEAVNKKVLSIYRGLDPSERMLSDQDGKKGYSDYLAHYSDVKKMKEFKALRKSLRRSQDVAHVESLYLTYPDQKTARLIYLVDGAYEDIWQPGTLEILYDTDFKEKGDIRSGFGSLLSDTEDGAKMVTTAKPIFNDENKVIAYASLDYSIESLLEDQRNYLLIAIVMIALLAAVSAFIVIKLVDRSIVKPINALSDASARYYSDGSDDTHQAHRFSDLNIHTGDEIETLANSMAKMEQDINDHIQALLSTKSELNYTKEFAEEMERNANKDALTGVRNKRAYEAEVKNLDAGISDNSSGIFGIAVIDVDDLKLVNDNYGHERGDETIIKISRIICEVFKHSPVFRYGGDEFVVILKNQDLNNITALIERFHSDLSDLRDDGKTDPWLKMNASIGFAVFDPASDSNTTSVFKRADKAMYKNKMRAKSSEE